jgi:hypothetical protein
MNTHTGLYASSVLLGACLLASCESSEVPSEVTSDSTTEAGSVVYCRQYSESLKQWLVAIAPDGVCPLGKEGLGTPIVFTGPPLLVWDEKNWDEGVWR